MQDYIKELLAQWNLSPWLWNAILVVLALLAGYALKLLLSLFVKKKASETRSFSMFYSILRYLGKPATYFLPLFLLNLLLPVMRMSPIVFHRVDKVIEIALIITFAWLLINSIHVVEEFVYHRYDFHKKNNLHERKVRTQLQFIRQFLTGLIVVVTIAAVLLSFSAMRKIGAGLLTGVGISGIIIGFAAQRSLANLLAGFQIAFTQPIRIDDVVVVEGEWGRIEEITLTYVVVCIWDERRLILPINYFIEKPFQNWTRSSSDLLGTVYIYTDYSVPVQEVRQELTRLLEGHALWDKKVNALQVTNATEKIVELRALMSAANSGEAFDLRCTIREQLIRFINDKYPGSLPKSRAVIEGATLEQMHLS